MWLQQQQWPGRTWMSLLKRIVLSAPHQLCVNSNQCAGKITPPSNQCNIKIGQLKEWMERHLHTPQNTMELSPLPNTCLNALYHSHLMLYHRPQNSHIHVFQWDLSPTRHMADSNSPQLSTTNRHPNWPDWHALPEKQRGNGASAVQLFCHTNTKNGAMAGSGEWGSKNAHENSCHAIQRECPQTWNRTSGLSTLLVHHITQSKWKRF